MRDLRISQELALPVDAATQTLLIVGKRGSGKSTTAARVVEQLLKAKVPVAVLDPVDSWWGLKAARDGVGQGHSVYVFGGRHADLPLEPAAGALIAEFLCEHRAPLVLSCKHMSGLERSRFMVDFALTLFRKWAGGVLHLVLEEAHELAPQAPPKGEKAEEMLGAFKRLWKLGRSSGIGGTAITQRPASLHKDVTTQSEILVVHRTIGPQDVEAVRQWIKYHHQGEEILSELAKLRTGEAFVWAPEFPEDAPIGLQRVQVLPRDTFDSSSTPKHGEHRAEPRELAAVDLERLRSKLAATIERAKAEDPRELRRQLADVRAQLARAQAAKPAAAAPAAKPKVVEKLTVKEVHIRRLEELARRTEVAGTRAQDAAACLAAQVREIKAAISAAREQPAQAEAGTSTWRSGSARAAAAPVRAMATPHSSCLEPTPRPRQAPSGGGNSDGGLGGGEKKVLTAIAQHPEGVTRDQLSVLAGYKKSTRDLYLQRLKAAALIDQQGDTLTATESGIDTLGSGFVPLPTGEALRQHWLGRLPEGERRCFLAAVESYPDVVDRDTLGDAVGYKKSTRDLYLQRLASRKLITTDRGQVRAADHLFEAAS